MDEEDGRVVVEEELIFEADDEEMAELVGWKIWSETFDHHVFFKILLSY